MRIVRRMAQHVVDDPLIDALAGQCRTEAVALGLVLRRELVVEALRKLQQTRSRPILERRNAKPV